MSGRRFTGWAHLWPQTVDAKLRIAVLCVVLCAGLLLLQCPPADPNAPQVFPLSKLEWVNYFQYHLKGYDKGLIAGCCCGGKQYNQKLELKLFANGYAIKWHGQF